MSIAVEPGTRRKVKVVVGEGTFLISPNSPVHHPDFKGYKPMEQFRAQKDRFIRGAQRRGLKVATMSAWRQRKWDAMVNAVGAVKAAASWEKIERWI